MTDPTCLFLQHFACTCTSPANEEQAKWTVAHDCAFHSQSGAAKRYAVSPVPWRLYEKCHLYTWVYEHKTEQFEWCETIPNNHHVALIRPIKSMHYRYRNNPVVWGILRIYGQKTYRFLYRRFQLSRTNSITSGAPPKPTSQTSETAPLSRQTEICIS